MARGAYKHKKKIRAVADVAHHLLRMQRLKDHQELR